MNYVPDRAPYIPHSTEENMAAAMARRASGMCLQVDVNTFSCHSLKSLNAKCLALFIVINKILIMWVWPVSINLAYETFH